MGIGVDVVDLARFERATTRTPALLPRLFAESERTDAGRPLPLRSLAGRFAAKEALIKALGESTGVGWHDMRVISGPERKPAFELSGAAAAIARRLGAGTMHLSMSHDAGIAIAYVVVEAA
ncbi:MAG: hypothetical protein RI885_76 [Actinomycetota bacterium]